MTSLLGPLLAAIHQGMALDGFALRIVIEQL